MLAAFGPLAGGLVLIGVIFLAAVPANAQILDQVSPNMNASFNADATSLTWQQEVEVGLAGTLVQVEMYVNTPGSCQFFICNTGQKDWDGRYTVFAQLVGDGSFETLDKLMATPTDEFGRPRRTLYMHSVRIVDAPSDAYLDTP